MQLGFEFEEHLDVLGTFFQTTAGQLAKGNSRPFLLFIKLEFFFRDDQRRGSLEVRGGDGNVCDGEFLVEMEYKFRSGGVDIEGDKGFTGESGRGRKKVGLDHNVIVLLWVSAMLHRINSIKSHVGIDTRGQSVVILRTGSDSTAKDRRDVRHVVIVSAETKIPSVGLKRRVLARKFVDVLIRYVIK